MALTAEQLTQAKALLDGGSFPFKIVNELSLDVKPQELRQALEAEYGKNVVATAMQAVRQNRKQDFSQLPNIIKNNVGKRNNLTVEDCDAMITNLNAAITEVIRIKSNIDVTP